MNKDNKDMTKITKTDTDAPVSAKRETTKRKKVYERIRETEIPQYLIDHFKKDNYDLKLIRWSINGEEDYRYLAKREQEGYEFVSKDELPEDYLKSVRVIDTKSVTGLVTFGDLCLTKIDSDLRKSRMDAYQQDTDREVAAVDINVLEKKGFRNLGTRSKVMMREPSFGE